MIQNKQKTSCDHNVSIMLDGKPIFKSLIYACADLDSRLGLWGTGNYKHGAIVGYIKLFKFHPIPETALQASRTFSSSEEEDEQNSIVTERGPAQKEPEIMMIQKFNSTIIEKSESTVTEVDGFKVYNYEWNIPEDYDDFIEA